MNKKKIRKVRLFPNQKEQSLIVSQRLEEKLIRYGFIIDDQDYELAIAIGGDGSFLRMVKDTGFRSDVYYVGIHTGTLGFLQEINQEALDLFVYRLLNKDYLLESIGIQETFLKTKKHEEKFYSLNEIVIREADLNTLKLEIKIDHILLEHFAGDGVLIATSVGSTAYNLSFGGSIVYPNFHTLQLTPIAPLNSKVYQNLRNSIVIPENKTILLRPMNSNKILFSVDGENKVYEEVEEIQTVVDRKKIQLLHMMDYDYTSIIYEKFLKN